jgi:hypothetical protein
MADYSCAANDCFGHPRTFAFQATYERTKGRRLIYLIEYDAYGYAISRAGKLLAEGNASAPTSQPDQLQAIMQLAIAKRAIENLAGMSDE